MPAKNDLPLLLPSDRYGLTTQDRLRFAEERAMGMCSPSDPVLMQVAAIVPPNKILAPKVQAVIQRLVQTAAGQQQANQREKQKRTLVGLAAPQIGVSLRIMVVDTKIGPERKMPGKLECFINPEIVWRSRETVEGREGCFSAGPVWGLVRRSVAIKIRAFTSEGKRIERIFEGFTARIVQHEYDHLRGIRFPELITSDKKRHWVHTEELDSYPEHIMHWPRLCSRARWEAFKRATKGA